MTVCQVLVKVHVGSRTAKRTCQWGRNPAGDRRKKKKNNQKDVINTEPEVQGGGDDGEMIVRRGEK